MPSEKPLPPLRTRLTVIFETPLARLYREIQSGRYSEDGIGLRLLDRMGVLNTEQTAVRDNYASNVEQFLNRIMVLHVETQNRIFDLFYERYVAAVEAESAAEVVRQLLEPMPPPRSKAPEPGRAWGR